MLARFFGANLAVEHLFFEQVVFLGKNNDVKGNVIIRFPVCVISCGEVNFRASICSPRDPFQNVIECHWLPLVRY